MKIEILGMGCARCRDLEQRTRTALAETGLAAEVEKVDDIQRIMAYKVIATPGLIIDGAVKAARGHDALAALEAIAFFNPLGQRLAQGLLVVGKIEIHVLVS